MQVYDSILQAVGETPVIRLRRLPQKGSAQVLLKLEFLNPSGSVKARPALRIIEEAEKAGRLGPGSIIVEASSGNQGISLAMIGAVKGYRVWVFMPESMSQERRKILQAYGAQVQITPVGKDMKDTLEKCIEASRAFARATEGSFLSCQFENEDNVRAHEEGTALEILRQTEARLDAFVSGIGTGGTITGVGRVLKSHIPGIQIIAAEPEKAPLLPKEAPFPAKEAPLLTEEVPLLEDEEHTETASREGEGLDRRGAFESSPGQAQKGVHIQEGIGDGIVPKILDKSVIDRSILVSDDEAIETARRLSREEGIFAGISTGTNVFAALLVARELGEGKIVLTIAPDGGEKYLSTALCR